MSAKEVEPYILVPAVGDALLRKGADCSLGELVADLEGDGTTVGSDPQHVWDKHFYLDVKHVGGNPDEPRDKEKTDDLLEALELFLSENPDTHLCETVCNAHIAQNGLGDFDTDETDYQSPISELTDAQLLDYLHKRTDGYGEDED